MHCNAIAMIAGMQKNLKNDTEELKTKCNAFFFSFLFFSLIPSHEQVTQVIPEMIFCRQEQGSRVRAELPSWPVAAWSSFFAQLFVDPIICWSNYFLIQLFFHPIIFSSNSWVSGVNIIPWCGDSPLHFVFFHLLRDEKHRDHLLVQILFVCCFAFVSSCPNQSVLRLGSEYLRCNFKVNVDTLINLRVATWYWWGWQRRRRRWTQAQVIKEKREKRWSPTEIENWARSQGCSSVGNLRFF